VIVPDSSVEYPGDTGLRAHTNHLIFVPSRPEAAAPLGVSSAPQGLTPSTLWAAYGLPDSTGMTDGAGSGVVAIVVAFDYPTALADLNAFSQQFGLPQETGSGTVFEVVYAAGSQPGYNSGWSQEAALDIEWAHAMAPTAKIVLVEAASNLFSDLLAAVSAANGIPGVREVSMSWGSSEFSGETSQETSFTASGVVYFAASGDAGGKTSWPGVCPNVVCVGGTTLTVDSSGHFVSETGWSKSGGGESAYEPRPSYQNGIRALVGTSRGIPDLSFDADPNTGVAIYWQGGWYIFGGTSLATPAVAGLVNLDGSASSSFAAGTLDELTNRIYANLGSSSPSPTPESPFYFRDIVSGSAGTFTCTPGWDFVTGAGSLWGLNGALLPQAAFSGQPMSGTAPLAVQFTDQSTNNPTSWSWSFGDGGSSTAQSPSHIYTVAGVYTISLTATNAAGSNRAMESDYITVNPPAPPADFSATPTSGTTPLPVTFTYLAPATPTWAAATAWQWDFGDGGSSTQQNPSHVYALPGSYTVSLTATNAGGSTTKTESNYIAVNPPAPSCDFSATPTAGLAPLPVSFTYLGSADPTWAVATAWQWSFGDGGTADAQDPSYSYAKPGSYTVSLIASNAGGSTTVTKPHYLLVSFPDVPVQPAFWALDQVLACVDAGIVQGYSDGTYKPTDPVTRDQMAVYISRALAGGDAKVPTGPATATFSDVPTDYWAFRYVEYAVSKNVVKGYSDGTYKPTDQVTRDQMAVFVARAIATPTAGADLVNYTPPATATFPDVATSFWAYKYVEYIAQPSVGVTKGYPDGDYHPEYICTRDQMAVYVARAFQLPL
jgi:PKD repeat protein